MKALSLPIGIIFVVAALALSHCARANEILVPLPPGSRGTAYLENRTASPGGQVRVTLIPYLSDIWYGTVSTRLVDGVLEVRMRYTTCGEDSPPCPVQPNLTLEFAAPQQPGIYGVRIYHVSYALQNPPPPELVMLMGTDVLTVRDPAEPIPTLESWGRVALVLLLMGMALPFMRRQ